MMTDRFKKQLDFFLEIDKVKNILRMTSIADGSRRENDAEHSWSLAIMAFLFVEYVDNYNDIKQILVDINLDENFNIFKYDKIEEKIEKSTIPFFEVPKILVVTKNNKDIKVPDKLDLDIDFVDINLSKLFKVI